MEDLDFVAQKKDIILLEDGERYVVEKLVRFDEESFLVVKKISDDVVEFLNPENPNIEVVKEIVESEDDYYLEIINDSKLKQKIFETLKK